MSLFFNTDAPRKRGRAALWLNNAGECVGMAVAGAWGCRDGERVKSLRFGPSVPGEKVRESWIEWAKSALQRG